MELTVCLLGSIELPQVLTPPFNRTFTTEAAETTDEQTRKLRARLRALYWAHDPRQVDKVDEILARQKVGERIVKSAKAAREAQSSERLTSTDAV